MLQACSCHVHLLSGRLLVIGLLASAACRPLLTRPPSEQQVSDPKALRVALGSGPQTLDPARASDSQSSVIIDALFAGLVDLDPQTLAPLPELAHSWRVEDGGRRYLFFLRPSVWSDGHPVTAHDFVFAWRRVVDPKTGSPSSSSLRLLVGADAILAGQAHSETLGVRAVDDLTLEVKLAQPAPYLFELLAHSLTKPVPRHVFERMRQQGHTEDRWTRPEHLVGNGPYALAAARFKRDVTLKKNPRYWAEHGVYFDTVHLQIVENDSTLTHLFLSGSLDATAVSSDASLPLPYLKILSQRSDFRRATMLSTYFYWLNVRRPPLSDPHIRRALSLAIDRRALCEELLRGGQMPTSRLVPPGMHPQQVAPNEPDLFDPSAARASLDASPLRQQLLGRKLKLLYNTQASHRQIAEAIANMWRAHLGIEVELVNQEWQVFLASVQAGDFDIARMGWVGDYADPINFLDDVVGPHAVNNASGWQDASFSAAIQKAHDMPGGARRLRVLADAERMLLEAQPLIPLFHSSSQSLVRPSLCGLCDNLLGRHTLHRLWRAPRGSTCSTGRDASARAPVAG